MSDPVSFEDMVPLVSMYVAHCPEPVVIDKLREAARRFFVESKTWNAPLDAIYVAAAEREIEVEHPEDCRVVGILEASFDGEPVKASTAFLLSRKYAKPWREESGVPEFVTMDSPDVLRLCPHPTADGTLQVQAVLAPSTEASEIPGWAHEEFRETIVHGTLELLYRIPKQPFTDMQASMYYGGLFSQGIGKAFARVSRGFASAPMKSAHVNA